MKHCSVDRLDYLILIIRETDDDANLADYMRKMLEKQPNIPTDENTFVPQQTVSFVTPGDWVLIRSIKKKHWQSPK